MAETGARPIRFLPGADGTVRKGRSASRERAIAGAVRRGCVRWGLRMKLLSRLGILGGVFTGATGFPTLIAREARTCRRTVVGFDEAGDDGVQGTQSGVRPARPEPADELLAVRSGLRERFPLYQTHSNRPPGAWLQDNVCHIVDIDRTPDSQVKRWADGFPAAAGRRSARPPSSAYFMLAGRIPHAATASANGRARERRGAASSQRLAANSPALGKL